MIKSGIFNSVSGDRKYKAEDFAKYFSSFIANGVFPNPSNNFQVMANNNMTLTLKPGNAWINGYYIVNDDNYNLTIEVADGVLNRIDRIVLQLNYLNREIVPVVKKGTFASSPVAPSLKRDADAYEIALADIYVGKGIINISQANITDLRMNTSLCGIVHGVVDQIDTTDLFAQYDDGFRTWFASIQDILDGDVAGNLTNRIATLEQSFSAHQADDAIDAHNASNISVLDANNRFTGSNVEEILNELFQFADNGKKDWATVVGAPLLTSDTFAQMKSKTQTIKNTLVTNLTNKGQLSLGTETLTALVNKIANISTAPKIAYGSFGTTRGNYVAGQGYKSIEGSISGLNFRPIYYLLLHTLRLSHYQETGIVTTSQYLRTNLQSMNLEITSTPSTGAGGGVIIGNSGTYYYRSISLTSDGCVLSASANGNFVFNDAQNVNYVLIGE